MSARQGKKIQFVLSLLSVLVLCFCFAETGMGEEKSSVKAGQKKVVVYYFHRTKRCRSCRKLESLTKQALGSNLKNEINNGTVEWKLVNLEMSGGSKYIKKFHLVSNGIVVAQKNGGKDGKWKNLNDAWRLMDDWEGFSSYIKKEVKGLLN